MKLTNMTPTTRARVYDLYMAAFPKEERKPFELIESKEKSGQMEILTIVGENAEFLGLVMNIFHGDIVLLDYLAISPEARGRGVGSEVLHLLTARYAGRRLVLEIEDPHEPCNNPDDRRRRYAFYLKNGLSVMPFRVCLFGVNMLILSNAQVTFPEYHAIFGAVFGEKASRNVMLL